MADKFEDLRIFISIIDNGGINAAAADLSIAKSAVSRRLSDLEERLGASLVDRSTRRFEPTMTGRQYYDGARRILSELDALDAAAGGKTTHGPVKVRIAADATLLIATAAAAADIAHAAAIDLVEAAGADEGIDLWVGTAPRDVKAFIKLDVTGGAMVVVGSPMLIERIDRPRVPRDLRLVAGIFIASRKVGGWDFGELGVHRPRSAMTVPDDASALAAAVAGAGLVRLPATVAGAAIRSGQLARVDLTGGGAPETITVWVRTDGGMAVKRMAEDLARRLGEQEG